MSLKVGIDFGTSNSGVAVYDGQHVRLLPVDPKNVLPEVIKTVLYITRDYRTYLGQEAVETYYRDNVNRQRRYVKQWAGEIDPAPVIESASWIFSFPVASSTTI